MSERMNGQRFEDMGNISNTIYPKELKKVEPLVAGLKITATVILMTIALLGNLSVIVTVARTRRMRTATNYFIVNLAVSDLMVTLSCTWVSLVADLTEGWVLGAFFCVFNSFAQVLSLVSSILTLTLIACDRFFGIVFALRSHLTNRKPSIFIVLVWLASIATSSPLLFHRKQEIRQWLNHAEVWCEDLDTWTKVTLYDPHTNDTLVSYPYRKLYYTAVSLILFFVPVVVMAMAYVIIIMKLWWHRAPGEGAATTDVKKKDGSTTTTQVKLKKKVIKMLLVVLGVFVVCWLPFQIAILYAEHRSEMTMLPDWYYELQYYGNLLAYTNSSINPIIYTCFNTNFRRGFKEAFFLRKATTAKRPSGNYFSSHVTRVDHTTRTGHSL